MKYICMVITTGWHCNTEAFCLFNRKRNKKSGQTEIKAETEMELHAADGNQLIVQFILTSLFQSGESVFFLRDHCTQRSAALMNTK